MARLDLEKQNELEPKRYAYAWEMFLSMGFSCYADTPKSIQITFKGEKVRFFPYSGWHTGKSIKDGRGLKNLLKQLKP